MSQETLLMREERETIVEFGIKMANSTLTTGTGGNLSIMNRELGYMAITPTGVPYETMKPEDVVIMDLENNVIDGKLKPSSEFDMHSIVYRNRTDVDALVHCHAIYATTLSTLRLPLPAVDYLVAHAGGKDVRCAEYATYGSPELAVNALKGMEGRTAVLLANHGLNSAGKTMAEAFAKAEQLEFCSQLYLQAKAAGEPVILSDEEMERNVEKFKTYGKQD
ncbi:L-fuculose-phosphate aldolase [Brevibacillus daliensis]|uniref:L-fuculose-phosphate aldolase n=1 Tax=Brevibacillus daliensis TaxID=2892995 RepID=UPI001E599F37|nr:L-fuculose-phosphate aldolase [Brevibacillus daliensis]